jgi:hypothetical protein
MATRFFAFTAPEFWRQMATNMKLLNDDTCALLKVVAVDDARDRYILQEKYSPFREIYSITPYL